MDTHEGRCQLLEIKYDLFELQSEEQLYDLGATQKESEWILQALDLAKKYDHMRREDKEETRHAPLIDHGIAGALILYDFLMKEHHRTACPKKNQIEAGRYRDPRLASGQSATSGEVAANINNDRFHICAILIACTVARHNMWSAKPDAFERYHRYGLNFLCQEQAIVSTENPLDQMLFMLDFMDTIDPMKGIYTREAERKADAQVLASRRQLLLEGLVFEFKNKNEHPYRWESALRYQEFTIAIADMGKEEYKEIFDCYAKSLVGLGEWLKTKCPHLQKDSKGRVSSITFYYPNIPRKQRQWAGGITENEIAALCLYEGSGGNGKSALFYQYHNAYQTMNLIMMDGTEGERARICEEGQNPNVIYIQEWEKTLEVMTDIFTAQCKFMEYWYKEKKEQPSIYRVDRKVNFEMMQIQERTFAFTSTSKKGYLENIAKNKKNLIFQKIVLQEKIPFIDYAELLKEMYVYSDEQEVLLPPFLKLHEVKDSEPIANEQGKAIPQHIVSFDRFEIDNVQGDEMELIERLDKYKNDAAAALENIKDSRKIDQYAEQTKHYVEWKRAFQALVRHCFFNIGAAYGLLINDR